MPFTIIRDDITKVGADAIVNAANPELLMGGGVCGAIFRAAGAEEMQAACDRLAPIQTGEAVITPGFNLPAKHVIHTAGPVYRDGKHGEEELLRSCYTNSLKLAQENGCKSVAFPLISSGIYGYPRQEAFAVAASAIRDFLEDSVPADSDMNVVLIVFDNAPLATSEELQQFVDENYTKGRGLKTSKWLVPVVGAVAGAALPSVPGIGSVTSAKRIVGATVGAVSADTISALIKNLDKSFSDKVMELIRKKRQKDIHVYKRANIDAKLFSKIRRQGYVPRKNTALALAIGLKLNYRETQDLLKHAGFTLSNSVKSDVIIKHFITRSEFNIHLINGALYDCKQQTLGSKWREDKAKR